MQRCEVSERRMCVWQESWKHVAVAEIPGCQAPQREGRNATREGDTCRRRRLWMRQTHFSWRHLNATRRRGPLEIYEICHGRHRRTLTMTQKAQRERFTSREVVLPRSAPA